MILDDSSGANIEITCGRATEQTAAVKADTRQESKAQTKHAVGKTDQGFEVDLTDVDIGSVVKIKGTIGMFRDSRQIQLERLCKLVHCAIMRNHGLDKFVAAANSFL